MSSNAKLPSSINFTLCCHNGTRMYFDWCDEVLVFIHTHATTTHIHSTDKRRHRFTKSELVDIESRAMESKDSSEAIASEIGWNFWEDGPLPPSHALFPAPSSTSPAHSVSTSLTATHKPPAPPMPTASSPVLIPPSMKSSIGDIEDIVSKLSPSHDNGNLPLMVELPIFRGGRFLSNIALQREVKRLMTMCSFLFFCLGGQVWSD